MALSWAAKEPIRGSSLNSTISARKKTFLEEGYPSTSQK